MNKLIIKILGSEKTTLYLILTIGIILGFLLGSNKAYNKSNTSFEIYHNLSSKYSAYYNINISEYLLNEDGFEIDTNMSLVGDSLLDDNVEATVYNTIEFVSEHIKFNLNGTIGEERNYGDSIQPFYSQIGVCEDYSRLAVSLLRYNGIYAKYVTGTSPNGVGHAWVEVLYPLQSRIIFWSPVDPQTNTFPSSYVDRKEFLAKDITEIQIYKKSINNNEMLIDDIINIERISFISDSGILGVLRN